MTPQELRRIRKETGLDQKPFARALGYADQDAYRKYETGIRPIPTLLDKLAQVIDKHGLPDEWIA